MPAPASPPPRTRLIGTIGPASAPPERFLALLDAGLNVVRVNFSHGDVAARTAAVQNVRQAAAARGVTLTIIGDLCGPKIRLGRFAAGPAAIAPGETIRIARGDGPCTPTSLTTSYAKLVDELLVGQHVLIDDGLVRLLVMEKSSQAVTCVCKTGGALSDRKGVNLPDSKLTMPSLTPKDLADLDWAVANDLDYVALSFVRRPEDLYALRRAIQQRGADIPVIVKIEKPEALGHLDELIENSDGVLVARGDLGVEMELWRVPLFQKDIAARCRAAGVPVIIATQMLQSMVENPGPTRAEVSDVANAVFDLADALMLSAETAVGRYPELAVDVLARVSRETEGYLARHPIADPSPDRISVASVTDAVTHAAAQAARELNARLVALWTASGASVRMIAKHRLPVPVVGLTWDERIARRINLMFGVVPLHVEPAAEPEEMFRRIDARLIARQLAAPGDLIIVVTATRIGQVGATNALMVHHVQPA
ncbi:MAG: Pyruvate kinase [Phycisphaerae bacterium]|nr:Pyruvate kinase [Phycisphaerae bacterium]